MTDAYVSEERILACDNCGITNHYLYHSGDWVCVECGESNEDGHD